MQITFSPRKDTCPPWKHLWTRNSNSRPWNIPENAPWTTGLRGKLGSTRIKTSCLRGVTSMWLLSRGSALNIRLKLLVCKTILKQYRLICAAYHSMASNFGPVSKSNKTYWDVRIQGSPKNSSCLMVCTKLRHQGGRDLQVLWFTTNYTARVLN